MSKLELCPTCKKGKFRATEEGSSSSSSSSTRELICGYCGQKRSNAGVNENIYSLFKLF
jgi:hypothetical protein